MAGLAELGQHFTQLHKRIRCGRGAAVLACSCSVGAVPVIDAVLLHHGILKQEATFRPLAFVSQYFRWRGIDEIGGRCIVLGQGRARLGQAFGHGLHAAGSLLIKEDRHRRQDRPSLFYLNRLGHQGDGRGRVHIAVTGGNNRRGRQLRQASRV